MRTTHNGTIHVPSFLSSGESARVRGQIAGRLPHLNQHQSTTNASLNSMPSHIPPHRLLENVAWTPRPNENQLETDGRGVHPTVLQQAANPLLPKTGGRGDKKRLDLWSIFGGDE